MEDSHDVEMSDLMTILKRASVRTTRGMTKKIKGREVINNKNDRKTEPVATTSTATAYDNDDDIPEVTIEVELEYGSGSQSSDTVVNIKVVNEKEKETSPQKEIVKKPKRKKGKRKAKAGKKQTLVLEDSQPNEPKPLLEPIEIVDAVQMNGDIGFLIIVEEIECRMVPFKEMREKYPQQLIEYFEKHCHFTEKSGSFRYGNTPP